MKGEIIGLDCFSFGELIVGNGRTDPPAGAQLTPFHHYVYHRKKCTRILRSHETSDESLMWIMPA